MSYQELKTQVLNLSLEERAALAHEQLQTLGQPSKEEIAALWVKEAERRLELVEKEEMPIISGPQAW